MLFTKLTYRLSISAILILVLSLIFALMSYFSTIEQKSILHKNQNNFLEIINKINLTSNTIDIKRLAVLNIDSILNIVNSQEKKYFGISSAKSGRIIIKSKEVEDADLISTPFSYSFEDSFQNKYIFFYLPINYLEINNKLSKHFNLISIILIIFAINCITIAFVLIHKIKSDKTLKNDFIYNMTHDFKTPLSTISIANDFLNKLDAHENNEALRKYTNIIKEETNRLKSMVEHILQITIIDDGKVSVFKEMCNLNLIIEEIVNSFDLIIKGKNGKISFEPGVQLFEVNCDKALISNVIRNLIDNAIKYSPDLPEILIKTINFDDKIKIIVQDKGIGIESKHFDQIFKKSFRINAISTKGFGIGLYYVKTIVEAHNGSIEVNSIPGKGSSFIINIPK